MSVRNPSAAKPAPLWVWGLTGGLLLLGSIFFLRSLQESYKVLNQKVSAYTSHSLLPATTSRVVVLGTSLTECGVASPAYFTRQAHGRYQLAKLSRNGANLETLTDRAPVFQALLQHPPAILCLEESLLIFDFGDDADWTLNRKLPVKLSDHFVRLVEAAKMAVRGQPAPLMVAAAAPSDTVNYRSKAAEIRQREVRPYAPAHSIHRYLRLLQAKGTRVVILHFPRPAALEQLVVSNPRVARLRDQYRQRDQLEYWHEPGSYSFAEFLDMAHLNQQGQARYSAWLAQRLLAEATATQPTTSN